MRVYISGAITGDPHYKERFNTAEHNLSSPLVHTTDGESFEAFNPIKFEEVLPQLTYEEYLKLDLEILKMCDAIFLLKGWEESNGAKIELKAAIDNGLKIMLEE